MPQLFKYPVKPLFLNDYIIGTTVPKADGTGENETRNFKAGEIVNTILAAINIGTVTSISTVSSTFINMVSAPSPITTVGTITPSINATGLAATAAGRKLQYLRGDNTWQLPGPTPTEVIALDDGTQLTADLSSINFTGNVAASGGATGFITVNFPGITALIDSIIAGAGITFTNNAGAATINNSGVVQVKAGGNITLSGGTGNVTISTVANSGTITIVNPGVGIATVANNVTNPELDVEYTGINNYILGNIVATTINQDDIINYQQIASSNVKSTKLRDLTIGSFTKLKTYIDAADLNKIKNIEPTGFNETAKATNIITCTIAEYNSIATKDVNTLYFILGAGVSYTQTFVIGSTNISGSSNFTISQTANGSSGTTVSGPIGTAFSFQVSISGTNGATISNASGFGTFTGNIAVNGGTTTTGTLTATVTDSAIPSIRAQLSSITLGGNLDSTTSRWQYDTGYNVIGDTDPAAGSSASTANGAQNYAYKFNTRIKLLDTNTYQWATGSAFAADAKYLDTGYDGGTWSQTWADGTVSNPPSVQNVVHAITGTSEFKPYQAQLRVTLDISYIDVNNSPISDPSISFSWTTSGGPATAYNNSKGSKTINSAPNYNNILLSTLTGLNNLNGDNLNKYQWRVISAVSPTLPTGYTWDTIPTFTWNSITTTPPNSSGEKVINSSDTSTLLKIQGEIKYAPVIQGSVVYVPTYIINGSSTSSLPANVNTNLAAGTTTPTLQISPTAATYSITPNPPTITAGSGYTLTNVSVTNTGIPLSGSMAGKSSTNNSTWNLTGTLAIIPAAAINPSSTVTLTAPPQGGYQVSYSVTFQYTRETGQQDTRTRAMTASASSPYTATVSQPQNNMAQSPTANFGELTLVINRTGYGSNIAGDAGSILISKNGGSTLFSYTITQGNSVSGVQYTVTGLTASSDYVTITIAEG